MIDGRAIVGAFLVAVGSVLAAAGSDPVLGVAQWLVARAGVLLLAFAAALALWAAVPSEARKAPLLLAGAGGAVLLLQRGVDRSVIVGGALIGLGALLSAFRSGDAFRDDVDPVHTYRRLGYPRRITARSTSRLPRQIRLLAVGVPPHVVDLSAAQPGQTEFLELVLTCWFTSVKIHLPPRWAAVAGSVVATKHVKFVGELDSSMLITDIEDAEQAKELGGLAKKRSARYPEHENARAMGVVIHVAGAFSKVTLVGR